MSPMSSLPWQSIDVKTLVFRIGHLDLALDMIGVVANWENSSPYVFNIVPIINIF